MGKVAITGGLGFVGSHLAEHFAQQGHEVVAFDNKTRPSSADGYEKTMELLSQYRRFTFVDGDVRNREQVGRALEGATAIFHTAGQVAVTWSMDSPATDFEINAGGTLNVLEAARQSKSDPRLVFCSTNKVYGGSVNAFGTTESPARYSFPDEHRDGVDEGTSIDQSDHSPYGASKLAADLYVQEYYHSYGLKSTVFRMSCIYGDRQTGLEDQGWVAWFAISTLRGSPIRIFGDGKQVRDVLFVDDLVSAFEAAVGNKAAAGQVFNIGGGPENTISLLELLDLLEKLTGKRSPLSYHPWRPGDQKVYVSDIRKAKRLLGWSPAVSPEEGVKRMLAYLEGRG